VLQVLEPLAERRGYRPLLVGAALLRAHLADRLGRLEELLAALALVRDRAQGTLWDEGLRRAVARPGLIAPAPRSAFAPWSCAVARLGLDRPAEVLLADAALDGGHGLRLVSRAELDRAHAAAPWDLLVDVGTGLLHVGGVRVDLAQKPLLLQLIVELAAAGSEGVTAEQLYLRVWEASEYHPLRHRNTVYVALNRLKGLVGGGAAEGIVERVAEGCYRIAPGRRVAVAHPASRAAVVEKRRASCAALTRWEEALAHTDRVSRSA
jgi:hypothetical protein